MGQQTQPPLEMTLLPTFGDYLRTVIRASKIPVSDLADQIGVHRRRLYAYMSGDRTPSKNTLAHMCEILEICPRDAEERINRRRVGRPRVPRNIAKT